MWAKAKTFNDQKIASKILNETNPKNIKRLGRQVKNFDENIWNKYKITIMKLIVFAKFSQNKNLSEKLISTKGYHLIENSPTDYFWGSGKDGTGKNVLGRILMAYRDNQTL